MKYCFTFGCGQKHENGYHVIEADNKLAARTIMCERFGTKWASIYESEEAAGVEEYKLHEVFWPPPEMFSVIIYQNGIVAEELSTELRTLVAARIYVTDCVKTIIELTSEQMSVLAHVTNPKGIMVWWIASNDNESNDMAPSLQTVLSLSRMGTKLPSLNEEEVEHIEFMVDAFIKRKEDKSKP